MKTVVDCEKNVKYIVKKVHTDGALRQRLLSFGLIRGAQISLLATSSNSSTVEIKVGKMNIALRHEEALKIEVMS
ncbi:MAG: FeoA family protein [Campylobacterota bacterium]|nr:FeoA family protein [Campylobacterota bacterium]